MEEILIVDSWHIPLTKRTVVDEEMMLAQLDLVRENLPKAFEDAEKIVRQREEILLQAEEYAQEIMEAAERRADQILDEMGIIQQAEMEANQIRKRVQQECEAIQEQTLTEIERMRLQAQQELEQMRLMALTECEDIQMVPMTTPTPFSPVSSSNSPKCSASFAMGGSSCKENHLPIIHLKQTLGTSATRPSSPPPKK
jgi:vacuolar-type H+-ATPase subunit H